MNDDNPNRRRAAMIDPGTANARQMRGTAPKSCVCATSRLAPTHVPTLSALPGVVERSKVAFGSRHPGNSANSFTRKNFWGEYHRGGRAREERGAAPTGMRRRRVSFDLQTLLKERQADKFALFERHLNPQALRVLRTLGFDIDYMRAEGPYLFDAAGQRYLDLLSGFGVFALGRNHPTVIRALEQVLHGKLAGLVQFDVSLLAGLLAERLLLRCLGWIKSFSATPAPRRSRRR